MKKLIQKISVSSLMLFAMTIGRVQAAPAGGTGYDISGNICEMVAKMGTLFGTLRTLAFVGAAFIIAGWAWEYISAGKGVDLKGVKDKGIGMLVGFALLFLIGMVITVFMPGNGFCRAEFEAW